jgi:hypothetical protein
VQAVDALGDGGTLLDRGAVENVLLSIYMRIGM